MLCKRAYSSHIHVVHIISATRLWSILPHLMMTKPQLCQRCSHQRVKACWRTCQSKWEHTKLQPSFFSGQPWYCECCQWLHFLWQIPLVESSIQVYRWNPIFFILCLDFVRTSIPNMLQQLVHSRCIWNIRWLTFVIQLDIVHTRPISSLGHVVRIWQSISKQRWCQRLLFYQQ